MARPAGWNGPTARGVPSGGGLPQAAWTRARKRKAWRTGAKPGVALPDGAVAVRRYARCCSIVLRPPSRHGPFPRRLEEARRLCRRAVGQGLVARGGERRARAAATDNCVVQKIPRDPRDRRATACRSVCCPRASTCSAAGRYSSPRPWWRVTVGRRFRTRPRPLRRPVACSCGGHQAACMPNWRLHRPAADGQRPESLLHTRAGTSGSEGHG